MTEEQKYLPSEIINKSTLNSHEYGWKRKDFKEVVDYAVKAGLGVVGGQVQFMFPDGTCELYWHKYDTKEKLAGESWLSYCERTKQECLEQFEALPNNLRLIEEGIEKFRFLREKSEQGVELENYLIFILYFDNSETEIAKKEK
ncbi:hypothetical protein AHMF7605_27030 [Adhaeribacter arboris]|uniref:Uncharacterized protein n=1 Tax=Adhaeribacter arboris TaxID=2072846 RepID=A0A2T2Y9B4_9BACT|nr:hypothetical protein [Adhaeribacter arboris]PSR52105.1 hypothetical protein AHMF7605_00500 [Adhaeribacter arboris]PSR55815.1 hypothetical protein AHMF7605_21095 [Adhaeribacter arboris]PSR56891.1 hypothetical protein AHMF7605_27030 [Adhaeribacter arboris]